MPYRRLPNTDKSRLNALKIAYEKGTELPPFKLAFSQETLQKLSSFLPKYEKGLAEYHNIQNIQSQSHREYQRKFKKAKVYISHFIQVVNMSIGRGDMPAETRSYYRLPRDERKLPSLNTEESLVEWGKKILEGEEQRKMKGLAPVTNPTIAVVKVNYDNFMDAYTYQKQLKENHKRASDHINQLREEADGIIVKIWDEVEASHSKHPDDVKKERSKAYGVVYVFRKNELGRMGLFKYDSSFSGR